MTSIKQFSIDLDVRFRDLDAMGHVNNAVYFTYFEEGRKSFFKKILNVTEPSGFNFVIAKIQCDFLSAITMENRVALQMWVGKIGIKSFDLKYKLFDPENDAKIYAVGESIQVCYDYSQNKSMAVSEEFKQTLLPYQSGD